jgi:hypothetical protein
LSLSAAVVADVGGRISRLALVGITFCQNYALSHPAWVWKKEGFGKTMAIVHTSSIIYGSIKATAIIVILLP